MNTPVILYEDDGTLLQGIESQRGAVSVARTTDDLAEAIGFAHTGIARILLCAVPVADLTASIIANLAQSEVRVAILAGPDDSLPIGAYRVDNTAALPQLLQAIEDIALGTVPAVGEQNQPRLDVSSSGYGYEISEESGSREAIYRVSDSGYGREPHSTSSAENTPYQYGYEAAEDTSYRPPQAPHNSAQYNDQRRVTQRKDFTAAESVLNETAAIIDGAESGQHTREDHHQFQPENTSYGHYPERGLEQADASHEAAPLENQPHLTDEQPTVLLSPLQESPQSSPQDTIAATRATEADGNRYGDIQPAEQQQAERGITSKRGTIFAVWGTAGAPGRSTVSINLAAAAAADGLSVCLIDADTYNPSLSPLLGLLDEYSGISQMCHFADRAALTEQNAREALSSVVLSKYRIDFLSGITRANRWPELRAKALAASIDWLAARYDLLILDVASCIEADEELSYDGPVPLRNGATITALEKADRIIMLGNADVIGVPRLIQTYEQLKEGGYDISPLTQIDLWMNKVRSDVGSHGTVGELRRAWERFGPSVELTGFLPYDRKSLDKAWMRGLTLRECAPKSPLTRAINELYHRYNLGSIYKQPHISTVGADAPNTAESPVIPRDTAAGKSSPSNASGNNRRGPLSFLKSRKKKGGS